MTIQLQSQFKSLLPSHQQLRWTGKTPW